MYALLSKNSVAGVIGFLLLSTTPAKGSPIDCATGEPQTINTTATCLLRQLSKLEKFDKDLLRTTEQARNIAEKADNELKQTNYSKAHMLYSSANGLKPSYDSLLGMGESVFRSLAAAPASGTQAANLCEETSRRWGALELANTYDVVLALHELAPNQAGALSDNALDGIKEKSACLHRLFPEKSATTPPCISQEAIQLCISAPGGKRQARTELKIDFNPATFESAFNK